MGVGLVLLQSGSRCCSFTSHKLYAVGFCFQPRELFASLFIISYNLDMERRVDLTKHSVDTVVVSCADFRFRPMVAEWIEEKFGEADLVAMPGASKAVLEVPGVVANIGVLVGLHHVRNIVVVDHMDCGAYGGSKKYDWDHAAEVSMHGQKLSEAKKLLEEKFPEVQVSVYLLGAEGELGEIGSRV